MYYLNFVKNVLFIYCYIINSYNFEDDDDDDDIHIKYCDGVDDDSIDKEEEENSDYLSKHESVKNI
jgi:hypothetical protein